MAQAVIQFVGQLNKYNVLLLDGGTPQEVAQLFEKIGLNKEKNGWKLRASEVATKVLRTAANAVLTERNAGHADEYTYVVNVPNLNVSVLQGVKKLNRFSDSIARFVDWAGNDDSTLLKNAIDKVIKFNYHGGSGYGKQRIVKLKSVVGEGKAQLLKGWDVVQSTGEKPAYRTYRVANIVGKIEVVG